MSQKAHLVGLDVLRFTAAFFVLTWHYTYWCWLGGAAEMPQRTVVAFPELENWTFFGIIGVEIFFVISGFVIAFSAERMTASEFFWNRASRLLPVLWIGATLALATRLLTGEAVQDLLRPYLLSLVMAPIGPYIDGVVWTLAVEAVFYGLIFVLLLAGRFALVEQLSAFLVAWSALYCAVTLLVGYGTLRGLIEANDLKAISWPATILLLKHGCFFATGIQLWLLYRKGRSAATVLVGLAALLTCLAALSISHGERFGSYLPLAIWLLAVAFAVLSVWLNGRISLALSRIRGPLKILGLMTYPVYLVHYVSGTAILSLAADWGLGRYGALVCATVYVLLVSYLIVIYLEPLGRAWIAAMARGQRVQSRQTA